MPDIKCIPNGSVVLFGPNTQEGREWMNSELQSEPWQWLGGSLVVDARFAQGLIDEAEVGGLSVSVE